MKKQKEIERLKALTYTDIYYEMEALKKTIAKHYQALQLQQTGVSSCCDMSVCMKLPKCSKQCKDCNSVQ